MSHTAVRLHVRRSYQSVFSRFPVDKLRGINKRLPVDEAARFFSSASTRPPLAALNGRVLFI